MAGLSYLRAPAWHERGPTHVVRARLGMSLSCDSSTQTELAHSTIYQKPQSARGALCRAKNLSRHTSAEGQRDNLCRAPGILTSPVRAAFNCPS